MVKVALQISGRLRFTPTSITSLMASIIETQQPDIFCSFWETENPKTLESWSNYIKPKLVDYEKIALMNNVYNFYDRLAINLQPMESSLLHNNYKSNFIHYKYGIPPSFMKHKFEETDPYEILLNFNSTDNLKYMAQIVEKYLVV